MLSLPAVDVSEAPIGDPRNARLPRRVVPLTTVFRARTDVGRCRLRSLGGTYSSAHPAAERLDRPGALEFYFNRTAIQSDTRALPDELRLIDGEALLADPHNHRPKHSRRKINRPDRISA